jgi:hypothetical protein
VNVTKLYHIPLQIAPVGYGNDVDCDLCGAWVVFSLAVKQEAGIFADLTA